MESCTSLVILSCNISLKGDEYTSYAFLSNILLRVKAEFAHTHLVVLFLLYLFQRIEELLSTGSFMVLGHCFE